MTSDAFSPDAVLAFWFDEIEPRQWWAKSDEFDRLIEARFGAVHRAAARCELFGWRSTPAGRLAEVIVLDQFSRNIHRDTPLAFACDPLALGLAQEAVTAGAAPVLADDQRPFLYMPYMHSESPLIQEQSLVLFAGTDNFDFARRHKAIVDRFGRYPHRNAILGRASTDEELEFLKTPGSAF